MPFETPLLSLTDGLLHGGAGFDWSFVDAVYCISLRERPDRSAAAQLQFQRVGLAGRVHFFRPAKHPKSPLTGIWNSHQAVARHALAAGHKRILVFEDDIKFFGNVTARGLGHIARTLEELPASWNLFYLGHWPIRVRFINRRVLQTRSACTHAYIANHSLLHWLAVARFEDITIDPLLRKRIGRGIDAVFASIGSTYALFPMLARQSASPSDHLSEKKRKRVRKARHLVTRTRMRELILSHLMRPNELFVVFKSLVLAWATGRAGQSGRGQHDQNWPRLLPTQLPPVAERALLANANDQGHTVRAKAG